LFEVRNLVSPDAPDRFLRDEDFVTYVPPAKVTDNDGDATVITHAIEVTANAAPKAALEAPAQVRVDETVYLDGTGSSDADGQLVIVHDMIGYFAAFHPKFAPKYVDLTEILGGAFKQYIDDVKSKDFPRPEHCYEMNKGELEKLGIDVDE
jgi:ketopantoate hydroxymethyltransferase